jgi:hypothetical protein
MENDRIKQIIVFIVKGSPNKDQLKYVNTTAPMENPINREGHISPPYADIILLTEYINNIDAGDSHKNNQPIVILKPLIFHLSL